jgi:hypothetical protein
MSPITIRERTTSDHVVIVALWAALTLAKRLDGAAAGINGEER